MRTRRPNISGLTPITTARLVTPLDGNRLSKILKRTTDNLPSHVKGNVEWRIDHSSGPGYYLLNPKNNQYIPLEFINDHWYRLRVYTGQAFISANSKVQPRANKTGYWNLDDWQHPDNVTQRQKVKLYVETTAEEAYEKYPTTLEATEEDALEHAQYIDRVLQEQEECLRQSAQPPVLNLETERISLATDPTISPFIAATASPSFTEPRQTTQESDSPTKPHSATTDEPSPEQERQNEPILEAQLEQGLVIQDQGSDELQYIDPPQPAIVFPPIPPRQVQYFPNIMAQPAAPKTGRLRGEIPDTFSGDRKKSELFK